MLGCMVEVQDLVNPIRIEACSRHEPVDTVPDPVGTVGDEDDLAGLVSEVVFVSDGADRI